MNKRSINMLKHIINKGPVKLSFLTNLLNVSYRTVLKDLKAIDEFLYDNFFPKITRNTKTGVYLDCPKSDSQKILDMLKDLQPYQYVMSREDRRNKIILQLLKEDKPITVEFLAECLLFSRTTVFKSLPEVEGWLEGMKLHLVKKTNFGISIEGAEADRRKAVMELLLMNADYDNITKLFKEYSITLAEFNPEVARMFEGLFDATRFEYIKLLVFTLEKDLNIEFTDLSCSTLIIYIGIMIERIKNAKVSKVVYENTKNMKKLKEFTIVENMCKNMSSYFKIEIPQEEVVNLMKYILCTSIQNNSDMQVESKDISPLHILCNNLILEVELKLGYKFKNYDNLFNGLLAHLSPAVNRIKYDMQLKDPLEADIKNNYSNLFECVKSACGSITNYTGNPINDAEIAYITLHFCAAIESQFLINEYKTRVVVVCSSGIGTAKMLESRLKGQFTNIEVVSTLSYQAYLQRSLLDVDLVISTILLENPGTPCIHVNPLLPEEDCAKIMSFLEKNNHATFDKRNTYLHLLDIIEKNCIVKNGLKLRTEIQGLLDYRGDEMASIKEAGVVQSKIEHPLEELLTKDAIRLKVQVSNWKEAVKTGAGILLEKNFILPNYIDALLKNGERMGPFGPYCVISPGIAMPHARPADGVIKTCMSLITLAAPVCFNHSKYDPVRIIIVFGSSDGRNHLKALEQLAYLLMDSEKINLLSNTIDMNKVINILKSV